MGIGIISKATLWKERDQSIEKKLEKLKKVNNQTSPAKKAEEKFDNLPKEYSDQGVSAFISIQEGCDRRL
jgi:tRNA A37 methylthiotransferase MiaB